MGICEICPSCGIFLLTPSLLETLLRTNLLEFSIGRDFGAVDHTNLPLKYLDTQSGDL